jgi:hypothetical protein
MQATYPSLTDAALVPFRALEAQIGVHPDILDRPECPYPDHIKDFVRRMLADNGPTELVRYDDDDLYGEICKLLEDIKKASLNVNTSDPKDKVQILKNATDLLTKLVGLREKQHNVREHARFIRSVIELLESLLTPAQRTEFVEKMGAYLDVQ